MKGARGKKGREEGVKERRRWGGVYLAVCLPVRALHRARVRSRLRGVGQKPPEFSDQPVLVGAWGILTREGVGRQRYAPADGAAAPKKRRPSLRLTEEPRFLRSASSSTEARRRKPRTAELIDMDSHVYFSIDSCLISDPC